MSPGARDEGRIRGRQAARVTLESASVAVMMGALVADVPGLSEAPGAWMLPLGAVALVTGGYATFRTLHYQGVAEARVRDALGGCLACHALEVTVAGDRLHCAACGYVGAADRGGRPLTPEEEESVDTEELADEVAIMLGDP